MTARTKGEKVGGGGERIRKRQRQRDGRTVGTYVIPYYFRQSPQQWGKMRVQVMHLTNF